MKGILGMQDSSKELLNLINFDGAKLVQVSGDILELDRPNLTFILCTLHGGNTCLSDIVKLEFLKSLLRGSNLLHRIFGIKFHHFYSFFQ